VWNDERRNAPYQGTTMERMSFGFSREHAELYDKVLDVYKNNERALAHACVRALAQLCESEHDEVKEEIVSSLSSHYAAEETSEEFFEREVTLDTPTMKWLQLLGERFGSDCPESTFMNGVILLSVMLDILSYKPDARLSIFPVNIPLSQIINGRPQSYH